MPSTVPATGFPDAADTVTHALSLARALSLAPARTLLPVPATAFPEPADTVTHALSLARALSLAPARTLLPVPATAFPEPADTVTHALSLARALSLAPARTLLPVPATAFPEPADTVTHALSLLARRRPPAPRTMFTVTAYLGGSTYGFDTMEDASEVTTDTGAPLRLIFTTGTAATAEEAADAAVGMGAEQLAFTTSAGEEIGGWAEFAVDRSRRDDAGQSWPTGTRALAPGDVLAVTSPQGTVTRFAVEPTGIFPLHPA